MQTPLPPHRALHSPQPYLKRKRIDTDGAETFLLNGQVLFQRLQNGVYTFDRKSKFDLARLCAMQAVIELQWSEGARFLRVGSREMVGGWQRLDYLHEMREEEQVTSSSARWKSGRLGIPTSHSSSLLMVPD
ncbi:MAG: hypothetical protein JXA93_19700 [Anaerolineae bacterium]|nr:hypothetical protein [Anaerolineae bacterium]